MGYMSRKPTSNEPETDDKFLEKLRKGDIVEGGKSKYIRFVLWTQEEGVYLGSCMGFGFWSKLDSVGQDCAATFESREQALEYAKTWNSQMLGLNTREIQCEDSYYATIEECVAAGLPRWEPDMSLRQK